MAETALQRIPLTGADCFLRAFDDEIRRKGSASHISQLVLRLGPGADVDLLRKLVEEIAQAQPIVRAPVGRRRGVGVPVYFVGRAAARPMPPVERLEQAGEEPGALPEAFYQRLNTRRQISRGELLRFDWAPRAESESLPAGSDLAISWAHQLLDGSGSERFVQWIDECYRGTSRVDTLPQPDEYAPPPPPKLNARERGDAARAWQRWMESMGDPAPISPAGPLRRQRQALRYEVLGLSESESERAIARANEKAGFLTPMLFYLAAAMRAHRAVFRARGVDPRSFVVPLPVNMRPKGSEGAIFRTHTSLLWFHALAAEVDDLDALIASLKAQRLACIKQKHIDNALHAMDFARRAPRRLYAHMARRAMRGELCSFFFAFTGEFAEGVESFLGSEVHDGFHVAPVPASPGSCTAMSTFRGRVNVTHVFQQGVFSERERAVFREQLLRDLAG